jgi:cation transport regulator ChaB
MPERRSDIPGTLKRSPAKAQRTFEKAHDSAVDTYGEGERAHRTAFAAVKHSFEKVGDHWEEKDHKGPSDPQAARGGARARRGQERRSEVSTSSAIRSRSSRSGLEAWASREHRE